MNNLAIVAELFKLGYGAKEADGLVQTHLPKILANLIHIAELDRRRMIEIKEQYPERFKTIEAQDVRL